MARFLDKKSLNTKCVFWPSLQLLSKTSSTLRRVQRYTVINVKTYSRKVPVIMILMKLIFPEQIFKKKSSNIKFHAIPTSNSRAVPCEETDMTKSVVAFRNFANAHKKTTQSVNDHFLIPCRIKEWAFSFQMKQKTMFGSMTISLRRKNLICS